MGELPSAAKELAEHPLGSLESFVREHDASETKYMHHFDKLVEKLDVIGPMGAEHQVKQDPTGTLKSIDPLLSTGLIAAWEYQLPEHLWPPIKETAKSQDATLKIRWSRENGYVQITNIGKALGIPNLKMVRHPIAIVN